MTLHVSAISLPLYIKELDKKRDIDIRKKEKALFKDEVSMYRLEEDTIDYILFIIRESTGRLI